YSARFRSHALATGQATGFTKAEEPFDLDIHPANGLHLTELVDRTGDGELLLQGHPRQRRDQGANFTQRGAVAVDVPVGLLQGNTRGDFQLVVLGVAAAQVTGKDHHALGVDRLTQADFTFDIHDPAAARVHGGADPGRHAEHRIAHGQYRQAVALADGRPGGVDQDYP